VRAVGAPVGEVAARCDRALLARVRANAQPLRARLLELAARAPEGWRSAARIALDAARLLEARGILVAYYPVTPVRVEAGRIAAVSLARYYFFGFAPSRSRRVIVFFPASGRALDPELRYILAHELAHAAGYHGEEEAYLLADALATMFPSDFAGTDRCAREYVSRMPEDMVEVSSFDRWVDEHLGEFYGSLFYCSEELKPVEG